MATFTQTQKKKRNGFVALLIAILLVAAALFYVVYCGEMAKSSYLENADFATALGQALDKRVRSVSADDLAKVRYLQVTNDGEHCSVFLGYDDFMEQYDKYMAQVDAAEAAEANGEEVPEVTEQHPQIFAKSAQFDVKKDAVITLDDVKYFTNAEVVNISGATVDSALLGTFKNLEEGYFGSCGITDVSALATLDLTKIKELNLSGNNITDWSPLEAIAEKVIINSGYTIGDDGNGGYTLIPMETTLKDQMEEDAKAAEEAAKAEEETTEETTEETAEETAE